MTAYVCNVCDNLDTCTHLPVVNHDDATVTPASAEIVKLKWYRATVVADFDTGLGFDADIAHCWGRGVRGCFFRKGERVIVARIPWKQDKPRWFVFELNGGRYGRKASMIETLTRTYLKADRPLVDATIEGEKQYDAWLWERAR